MGKQRGGNTHDDMMLRAWFSLVVFGFSFCAAFAVREKRRGDGPRSWEDWLEALFFAFGMTVFIGMGAGMG